jgi:GT2 family glycosyltransferase/glycosyltransferase involved in cell wall biosynthesis
MKVDIIIPIYNQLSHLKKCLESVLNHSHKVTYCLYLIDDSSDGKTNSFLKSLISKYNHVILARNHKNLGFLQSCNRGITLSDAPYILLLNSDVIVTPNWLERLLTCAESDPKIAAVNPVTNHASNIDIPIVPGANFLGMDWYIKQNSHCNYPDVVTGVGFCWLLRRSALEEVGVFDEIYDRGYCEDSDLCMRLIQKGYRTVIADNVYVYHKGGASFKQQRQTAYIKNRQIFDQRWSQEYQKQYEAFLKANPLKSIRLLFQPLKKRWSPIEFLKKTVPDLKYYWTNSQFLRLGKKTLKTVLHLPQAKREIAIPEFVNKFTRPKRLQVTYFLPGMSVTGGTLSVIQLVNELILLGIEARIVTFKVDPEIYDWQLLTQPIILQTFSEVLEYFPYSDIAVATLWTTAPTVARLVQSERVKTGVYYIQDYESWFYSEDDPKREQVKQTYPLISHRIVKSDWLANLLAEEGYATNKICLGMDLGVFYPRDITRSNCPSILAMVRQDTPRRGSPYVIKGLELVKNSIPQAEIILFGDDQLNSGNIPFSYRDEGVISDRDHLATLYSEADIFLDGSNFQGFGRGALEAMACGTACVLTDVGGVSEYAKHRQNCLLVPPKEPQQFAKSIIELIQNPQLKQRLIYQGFQTVAQYCHKREAKETLAYFQTLLAF